MHLYASGWRKSHTSNLVRAKGGLSFPKSFADGWKAAEDAYQICHCQEKSTDCTGFSDQYDSSAPKVAKKIHFVWLTQRHVLVSAETTTEVERMKVTKDVLIVIVAGALVAASPLWVQAGDATKAPAPETKKATSRPDRLDINTATPEQLKAIQGLNESQVKKIIDGRPYNRRNELVSKKILSQETYDKIKQQIGVRRPSQKAS
jgi:competence protein ComEA